jgi:DNA-binding MarR family transcriptional regulator
VLRQARRAREAWLARQLAELEPDERETLRRAAEILTRIARA